MWITEFGFPSRPDGAGTAHKEVQQRQLIRAAYLNFLTLDKPPKTIIVHRLLDSPNVNNPGDLETRLMGTVRYGDAPEWNFTWKPAFCEFAALADAPDPRPIQGVTGDPRFCGARPSLD